MSNAAHLLPARPEGDNPRSWVFGDNLNTDVLHPPHFYSLDPERVKRGLFKGVDDTLQTRIRPGDIIVAGRNFGCGSSRETSVRSLLLNRIDAVIAVDFARIFFRSATNHGLPCLTLERAEDVARFTHGGPVRLDLGSWSVELEGGERVSIEPMSPFVQQIWQVGGLLALLERGDGPGA
jgi:3-isopropylmalate dehydratase small subunit